MFAKPKRLTHGNKIIISERTVWNQSCHRGPVVCVFEAVLFLRQEERYAHAEGPALALQALQHRS
jgi:hypothetical protein